MTVRPLIGVGVLIFNEHNQLLLGKRIASHGQSSWGPVGGHLEWGERFEECAAREILEETGLHITAFEFIGLTNDVFPDTNKHYVSIFLKAFCPHTQQPQNLEPHTTEKWEWFEQTSLPAALFLPLQNLMLGNAYGATLG